MVQVWFSLQPKFNSFELDSEVGRLVSHLFGYPKLLEWPQIWYSGTGYYHTELVGAFGGYFLAIFGYFRGACLEPICHPFGPNLVQWGRV